MGKENLNGFQINERGHKLIADLQLRSGFEYDGFNGVAIKTVKPNS